MAKRSDLLSRRLTTPGMMATAEGPMLCARPPHPAAQQAAAQMSAHARMRRPPRSGRDQLVDAEHGEWVRRTLAHEGGRRPAIIAGMQHSTVLGAGAWGTALAKVLADKGES